MWRRSYRSASAYGVAIFAFLLLQDARNAANAEESKDPKLTATMQCDHAAEPGRVKCSVEAHATGGRSITWADVALIELPDFTAALKGRLGPNDATSRDATSQKWAFGLVARKTGDGDAKARVRALVCEPLTSEAGAPKCAPTSIDVKVNVHVG